MADMLQVCSTIISFLFMLIGLAGLIVTIRAQRRNERRVEQEAVRDFLEDALHLVNTVSFEMRLFHEGSREVVRRALEEVQSACSRLNMCPFAAEQSEGQDRASQAFHNWEALKRVLQIVCDRPEAPREVFDAIRQAAGGSGKRTDLGQWVEKQSALARSVDPAIKDLLRLRPRAQRWSDEAVAKDFDALCTAAEKYRMAAGRIAGDDVLEAAQELAMASVALGRAAYRFYDTATSTLVGLD